MSRPSWFPSRRCRAIPKGNPVALIVDAAGKVEQRMLTLDRAIGDQWLVSSGLAPGDRVIVEGMQKVRPGASVKVVPFERPQDRRQTPKYGPAACKIELTEAPMLSRFFLDRPVFAWVIAIIMMVAGGLAIYNLPISQYPPIAPPSIAIHAFYPGASAETVENSVTQIIEQKMTGFDKMLYLSGHQRFGRRLAHRADLHPGHRSGPGLGQGAEQAPARHGQPAGGGPALRASRSASPPGTTCSSWA